MSQTADKAARLFNRLTTRYLVPDGHVHDLTVTANQDAITIDARLRNGARCLHDLDPTRGVLDLSRQAQAVINQHINK